MTNEITAFTAKEGMLFAARVDEDGLHLRCDRSGFLLDEKEERPVIALTLSGGSDLAEASRILKENGEEWLYLSCTPEADGTISFSFAFDIDDGALEFTASCAQASIEETEYTRDDLRLKCQKIQALYLSTSDHEIAIRHHYHSFREGLKGEVENEMERCRRKEAFFATNNPGRATEMQAQLKCYERVLTLMAHLSKEKNVKSHAD